MIKYLTPIALYKNLKRELGGGFGGVSQETKKVHASLGKARLGLNYIRDLLRENIATNRRYDLYETVDACDAR